MAGWAKPRMDRRQVRLFSPTLDSMVPEDHPVRLFDEILSLQDWSAWESHYVQVAGQPAIHPRVVAGAILYGLSQGVRSSRRLEWACRNAMDFLWLVECRAIDHSTFCNFRTRFAKELKSLFRQIGRLAMTMGLVRLNQVALDGTAIRANSSRYRTAKVGELKEHLGQLDEQIERLFSEAEQADRQETDLFGREVSPNHLPKALADLRKRQEKLKAALAAASERGARASSRVPLTDPSASVSPNKEGGYAPNHLPMTAVDGEKGFVVASAVADRPDEGSQTVGLVDEVAEQFEQMPAQVLADSKHGSGTNLAALSERAVEAYIPQEQRQDGPANPARRADPRVPVPPERWGQLPRNPRTRKLDRSAFVYDAEGDCFWCPQGKRVGFSHKYTDRGRGKTVRHYRMYRCADCEGCRMAGTCLAGKSGWRSLSRDENEPLREAMDARLRSDSGRRIYARRKWIVETPFAFMKQWMGLRQFLLRGLEKVRTEWLWSCTAYNLSKLVREVFRIRRQLQMALA